VGIVEGCPAGVPLSAADIDEHLRRRWIGFGRGGRAKIESDRIHIYSGVRFGATMGSPVSLRLDNAVHERDRAGWPDVMAVEGSGEGVDPVTLPRPGHADLAGLQKYGHALPDGRPDIRPVIERASARETAMRVACCTVARQLLRALGIEVGSHVVRIGAIGYATSDDWAQVSGPILREGAARGLYEAADESEVRILDPQTAAMAVDHIKAAKKSGDTLGGVYEVVVTGVPAGLGSYVQWDRRLDGRLAQAILSIQAQKAVEIGEGFAAGFRPGSAIHDPIVKDGDGRLTRASNHAGGIEGGITTGMPIVVRGVMKPIPTLIRPLGTVDIEKGEEQPTRYERSDVTSVPAASVVAEATVAFEIANAVLEKFGGDSLEEVRERVEAWRETYWKL
jgi:chorismate synthase